MEDYQSIRPDSVYSKNVDSNEGEVTLNIMPKKFIILRLNKDYILTVMFWLNLSCIVSIGISRV